MRQSFLDKAPLFWHLSTKKFIPSRLPRVCEHDRHDTEFVQVLVNPGRFFKERMKDEPGLKIPMLITLVYGLISAVSAALAVNMIIALLPAEAQTPGVMMKLMVAVAAAATAIITAYLTWFAVGIIFHLLSMLFKAKDRSSGRWRLRATVFCPRSSGASSGPSSPTRSYRT